MSPPMSGAESPRIEDYALLGDLQTAALVHRSGSIDWTCFPRFDSGACFAGLLGTPENGRWLLAPATGSQSTERCYRNNSLILETIHQTDEGRIRVIDFMPPRGGGARHCPDRRRVGRHGVDAVRADHPL